MQWLKDLLIKLYGAYAVVAVAVCVLVAGLVVLLTPGLARRRRNARRGLRVMFFCAGMGFRVEGLERLPDETCIAIANHRSFLDGLVLIAALPPRFTPVIKMDVSHWPVISLVLRRINVRYMQREPTMQAASDTKGLLDALRDGESLAMFPEGTFSVDVGLLPFRGGAFLLAAEAEVPVVPVSIQGSRNVLPLQQVLPQPGAVKVEVLEVLRATGANDDAARELRDRAEQAMWHGLNPYQPDIPPNIPDYTYYRDALAGRSLPQAYVDLDVLEDNIRAVLARTGNKHLRLDAHALRCGAVIDRVLRSDIRFQGVKCAHADEAVYLAREWKLEDLLVAYPTMQRDAIEQVCAAIADGCDITMTADAPSHLACLSAAAQHADITLPVCMEMDLSNRHGSHRSPLRTCDDLLTLLDVLDNYRHLQFRGVLAFDTQRHNTPGGFTMPFRRQSPRAALGVGEQRQLLARRHAIVERLGAQGYTLDLFNGGGAGGVEFNAADTQISEITIGPALFAPEADKHNLQPAAGFAAEVMRHPSSDVYACLSGGYNAADTLAFAGLPKPFLPPGAKLGSTDGVGEGHIPVHYPGKLRLGDPLFLCPPNTGELCERFSQLLLIQGGAIVDVAATYRAVGLRTV